MVEISLQPWSVFRPDGVRYFAGHHTCIIVLSVEASFYKMLGHNNNLIFEDTSFMLTRNSPHKLSRFSTTAINQTLYMILSYLITATGNSILGHSYPSFGNEHTV